MHRIKIEHLKWRSVTRVLCDRKILDKVKLKFYRIMVRQTMLIGSECWMSAAEMRILR